MEAILFQYELNPTTWAYIASIALIGFFFKFNRVVTVRNLDLLALIALAPGLLLVSHGRGSPTLPPSETVEACGFYVLFGVGLFFMGRLIADTLMTRRPLLEPNLSQGGLTWIGLALFVFLAAALLTMPSGGVAAPGGQAVSDARLKFAILDLFPAIPSRTFHWISGETTTINPLTSRILCILGHLAVVAGLIYVGQRHFDNLWTGVGMATLYLILPYTFEFGGRLQHVVPAALLVWMVALYRHPLATGMLLGLSVGLIYYTVFLIPLWASFYVRRGGLRFLAGLGCTVGLVAGSVALFMPERLGMFWEHYKDMFNPFHGGAEGLWAHWNPYMRLPLSVLFCCFALGMVLWPARKNLGTLLSCSAAVMLGTQFWYPDGGLLLMNWYLPLLLLTLYRPNLEHRVATTTVAVRSVRRRAPVAVVQDLPA